MKALQRFRIFALGFLALCGLACTVPAQAQVFDFQQARVPVANLTGLWRFHTGDNPKWAAPGLDVSSWKLLKSDESWASQGYRGYSGLAWYRFKVVLPAKHPALAISIPALETSYQVYANGQRIGQFGGMPPHAKAVGSLPRVFSIPQNLLVAGRPLTIAIRVWQWRYWPEVVGGGPQSGGGPVQIGDAATLNKLLDLAYKGQFWRNASGNVQILIQLLAGIAGIALFWFGSREREYLWFGAAELLGAALSTVQVLRSFFQLGVLNNVAAQIILNTAESVCMLVFLFLLMKQRRGRLYWTALASALLVLLALIPLEMHWIAIAGLLTAGDIVSLPYYACILLLLVRGARRGNEDARLLIGFFALSYLISYLSDGLAIVIFASRSSLPDWFYTVYQHFYVVSSRPFPFSASDVASVLLQLALLTVLLLRFARMRREEQRMVQELEAARAVQAVMIPREQPAIPGFEIDCVYRPAAEVGGDFYQVIALENDGALVVIGDVSGKGMAAAMTVSMLVGVLRGLAGRVSSPAALLAEMNARMVGHTGGGFTTCLAMRVHADGACTLANAGHLHPYVNGSEISLEGGLPLGLMEEASYAEEKIRLAEQDRLTLMTDGVVEARATDGRLLGFERVEEIAAQGAAAIADEAQGFGQQDDITVLTVTRQTGNRVSPASIPMVAPVPA
jgi:hypothetical protein